jgi:serine/threonine-protein kinase
MTRTGSVVGTPLYMSPEQARGKKDIDHRTDVWSLGVVLYEALTGRTPHRDPDTIGDLIVQICAEEPLPLQDYAPWVPPEVAAIVRKALSRDPSRRFASASAMFDAIAALLPKGDDLDVSAFASLAPEMRNHVAPKLPPPTEVAPPPSSLPVMASRSIPSRAVSDALYSRTTAGFSRSPWSSRPPASRARQLVVGALALAGLAAVVFVVVHRDHPSAPVAASSPPLHTVAPPVLPSAPPPVSVTTLVPVITLDALPVSSASAAASSQPPAPHTSKKTNPPPTTVHVSVPATKKSSDDDLYKP